MLMAQYKSKPVTVGRPAGFISEKFSDLSSFGQVIDQLPEQERARIGEVSFDKDSITIDTRQVGSIRFQVVERTDERIVMKAVGSPVPLDLCVNLAAIDDNSTEIVTAIDVDIPAMLRPIIGGAMQKAVDGFGDLMAKLNS